MPLHKIEGDISGKYPNESDNPEKNPLPPNSLGNVTLQSIFLHEELYSWFGIDFLHNLNPISFNDIEEKTRKNHLKKVTILKNDKLYFNFQNKINAI